MKVFSIIIIYTSSNNFIKSILFIKKIKSFERQSKQFTSGIRRYKDMVKHTETSLRFDSSKIHIQTLIYTTEFWLIFLQMIYVNTNRKLVTFYS